MHYNPFAIQTCPHCGFTAMADPFFGARRHAPEGRRTHWIQDHQSWCRRCRADRSWHLLEPAEDEAA
ncbi:MAG: hypothetical protein KC656_19310 [Myxococcales bacterium]|nr:hypothetical protein [Myxococcales bacterium]